jgi:hypothetical protein
MGIAQIAQFCATQLEAINEIGTAYNGGYRASAARGADHGALLALGLSGDRIVEYERSASRPESAGIGWSAAWLTAVCRCDREVGPFCQLPDYCQAPFRGFAVAAGRSAIWDPADPRPSAALRLSGSCRLVLVDNDVIRMSGLLRQRNAINAEIAAVILRPMTSGHLGEWIASMVFDIDLEPSATAKAVDGRFRSGQLAGRTVNLKWYLKREGLLDMTSSPALDFYLVLAGPAVPAASSRGSTRPWTVEAVYLFDARQIRDEQEVRGVKQAVASSVLKSQWDAAEIYPRAGARLPLTAGQSGVLSSLRA